MPTPLQLQSRIVDEFQALPTWEDRYQRIIALGRALPPLPDELRTDDRKVRGCSSTVWLHASTEADGRVRYQADSDAAIPKGLVALLLHVYNGHKPTDILAAPPEFIEELGLNQNLSPNRANGLSAMAKQVMAYAAALSAAR
jgi:cysteine desulfuration protein SufE